jgi:hypothetical protein
MRQVLLAPRELDLNQIGAAQARWVISHTIYTHGYGLALAEANRITPSGLPELLIRNAPVEVLTPSLTLERPEIYYGEQSRDPVFVRTTQPEFNYPSGSEDVNTSYDGQGGFPIGSLGLRLAAAWALSDWNIVLSDALTPEERYDETVKLFTDTGKVWFTNDAVEIQKLRDVVFIDGHLNKDVVGKTAREIGALAGIDVPATARIILLPAKGAGTDDVLAKEKLCPVVAILPYKTFHDAVAKAKANLLVEGAGHSAALHSNDETNIREAGVELPISRLVVNQASSLTAGGSLTNGFAPTTTLGCGSWGGNSISENLDYKHLMNVSRIGKVIANKKVPTDEEIFS